MRGHPPQFEISETDPQHFTDGLGGVAEARVLGVQGPAEFSLYRTTPHAVSFVVPPFATARRAGFGSARQRSRNSPFPCAVGLSLKARFRRGTVAPDVWLGRKLRVLLASEATRRGGVAHAELEILTPDDGAVLRVSTDDVSVVSLPQEFVTDAVGRFAADREFARSPSGACRSCAANGWCDPPDDLVASRPARIVDGYESAGTESADVVPF